MRTTLRVVLALSLTLIVAAVVVAWTTTPRDFGALCSAVSRTYPMAGDCDYSIGHAIRELLLGLVIP
jgi:hypothetical protein